MRRLQGEGRLQADDLKNPVSVGGHRGGGEGYKTNASVSGKNKTST